MHASGLPKPFSGREECKKWRSHAHLTDLYKKSCMHFLGDTFQERESERKDKEGKEGRAMKKHTRLPRQDSVEPVEPNDAPPPCCNGRLACSAVVVFFAGVCMVRLIMCRDGLLSMTWPLPGLSLPPSVSPSPAQTGLDGYQIVGHQSRPVGAREDVPPGIYIAESALVSPPPTPPPPFTPLVWTNML